MLNNTKLRHFWAQIVSWAPRHGRKTFIVLAQGYISPETVSVVWSVTSLHQLHLLWFKLQSKSVVESSNVNWKVCGIYLPSTGRFSWCRGQCFQYNLNLGTFYGSCLFPVQVCSSLEPTLVAMFYFITATSQSLQYFHHKSVSVRVYCILVQCELVMLPLILNAQV